jgi:hypothetical protein
MVGEGLVALELLEGFEHQGVLVRPERAFIQPLYVGIGIPDRKRLQAAQRQGFLQLSAEGLHRGGSQIHGPARGARRAGGDRVR